jgi:4-hydroxy-2-oxoheptanedioate aldolase
MRPSRIRKKLSANQPVLITSLNLPNFALFEFVSLMGFDGIWLDLEHHALSVETAENLMRAARVGSSDIVARPAKGEFMRLARLLEAGAQGIMYPRCESAAEAAEVVKWAKFPPLGCRGIDGGNPDVPYGTRPPQQYVKEANEQTFIIVQLEEQRAIDQADEIAAVNGIDVLFLGPGDYTSLGGFPGQFDHPLLAKATEQIAAAAKRAGKHWGRPAFTIDDARKYLSMGAGLISHSSDTRLLKLNYERIQREFGELGFEFNNHFSSQSS